MSDVTLMWMDIRSGPFGPGFGALHCSFMAQTGTPNLIVHPRKYGSQVTPKRLNPALPPTQFITKGVRPCPFFGARATGPMNVLRGHMLNIGMSLLCARGEGCGTSGGGQMYKKTTKNRAG